MTRNSKTICPTCRRDINCTAGFGLPESGDMTICLYCRSVSRFTTDMSLELYKTWEELDKGERSELMETLERFLLTLNRENN